MSENNFLNLRQYLNKINDIYSKKENQTLTETLNNFSQLSKSYASFDKSNILEKQYSSYNFLECTREEQLNFYNDQLQLIECLVTKSIYDKTGIVWNWGDIFKLILDKTYSTVDKIQRKVVFSTSSTQRPIADVSYSMWNGLQIIDLDIKNAGLALKLKDILFNELKKYYWFLGICLSA